MAIEVEIDKNSGFCGGVIRAIGNAEKYLEEHPEGNLYSLGAIVHNDAELLRLSSKGLITIGVEDLASMDGMEGQPILIRAHGEPPSTYETVKSKNLTVIDCTCPVVLKLQESIRESYRKLKSSNPDGQLLIFGKVGHAEVLGLVGQVNGDAVVIENRDMLSKYIVDGTVRIDVPTEIFSQTTKSPSEYQDLCAVLKSALKGKGKLNVHNTVCKQVASRHVKLVKFARHHDVVVFVSGKTSSNGKVLCEICKSVNIRTYHVGGVQDIKKEWFRSDDKVGVCGATSTPKWLLEGVASYIAEL